MNDSNKYISNAISNACMSGIRNNNPQQYVDQQKQYYASQTREFIRQRAKYSSDFVSANVQGLCVKSNNFYDYIMTHIRLSDLHSTMDESSQKDDVKTVLFSEPSITYFPIGAKIQTMGNTWICVNPSNIGKGFPTAVIKRCNASYNLYDYYGNILTEPIIVESSSMSNNKDKESQNNELMQGNFDVTCQLNKNTKQLGQNQRIILGSKAYRITGFTDFIQEFASETDGVNENDALKGMFDVNPETGALTYTRQANGYLGTRFNLGGRNDSDLIAKTKSPPVSAVDFQVQNAHLYASEIKKSRVVHLLRFTIRIDEPTENDDMEKLIANGKSHSYYAQISGNTNLLLTETTILTAHFFKNGEEVESSEEYPLTWLWESSDETIVTIDENGTVTPVKSGTAEIYVFLAQNPSIMAIFKLVVEEVMDEPYIAILKGATESISQYKTASFTAGLYEKGRLTKKIVNWSFSGADSRSYTAEINKNTVTIYCLNQDNTPLTITATRDGATTSFQVNLEGY